MKKLKIIIAGLGIIAYFWSALGAVSLAASCDLSKPPQFDSSGNPIACSCPAGYVHPTDSKGDAVSNECYECASGQRVSPTKCAQLGSGCNKADTACLKNNPLTKDLNTVVNFLSVGVGVVVIAMIIIGGVQYSMAGDNPQALTAARGRISNALIALAVYLLLFAFLQWLIPGGVFG